MGSFMNLEVMQDDRLNWAEKAIYHLIKDGKSTIRELMQEGYPRDYLNKCLRNLIKLCLVQNVERGIYWVCAIEHTTCVPQHTNDRDTTTQCVPQHTTCVPEHTNCVPESTSEATNKKGNLKEDLKESEINKKGASLSKLFEGIDFEHNEEHKRVRALIREVIFEKDLLDDLVDRYAAAHLKRLSGFDKRTIEEVQREAAQLQKTGTLKRRWYVLAKYCQEGLERHGFHWTKCRPQKIRRIDDQIAAKFPAANGATASVQQSAAPPETFYDTMMDDARKIVHGEKEIRYATKADELRAQEELRNAVEYYEEIEEIPLRRHAAPSPADEAPKLSYADMIQELKRTQAENERLRREQKSTKKPPTERSGFEPLQRKFAKAREE